MSTADLQDKYRNLAQAFWLLQLEYSTLRFEHMLFKCANAQRKKKPPTA